MIPKYFYKQTSDFDDNGTFETTVQQALFALGNQDATRVRVLDAGANFTSNNVEGALAELANSIPTALTQGSIPFADAGGSLAEDNNNFFWDQANSRMFVGLNAAERTIGTTSNPANVFLGHDNGNNVAYPLQLTHTNVTILWLMA